MTFWSDRRKASNSPCEVARFSRSWRACCPRWRIWSRRVCSIRCGRRATFAFPALTMSAQLCSYACAGSTGDGYQVQFEFLPWQAGISELVERGQLDLILHIDDGLLPVHFHTERLYREDWVCAVARDSHFGDRLSLKHYLAASHIVVATYGGVQTIPDKQLAAVGAKRSSSIRVPYFGVALQCLPGTELVLTLTTGMTSAVKRNRDLRLVKAPQELRPFYFLMAWHPRLNSDPPHVWLRQAVRSAAGSLISS
jgi:DNA-binding transcriptional LysR family regulator